MLKKNKARGIILPNFSYMTTASKTMGFGGKDRCKDPQNSIESPERDLQLIFDKGIKAIQ